MMFDFSKVLIKKHSFNNNKIHEYQYIKPETLIVNDIGVEKFVLSIKHLLEKTCIKTRLKLKISNFKSQILVSSV